MQTAPPGSSVSESTNLAPRASSSRTTCSLCTICLRTYTGAPWISSARSTISMARRTPAQKPCGSARMIFFPPGCCLFFSAVAIFKMVANHGDSVNGWRLARYCSTGRMPGYCYLSADDSCESVIEHQIEGGVEYRRTGPLPAPVQGAVNGPTSPGVDGTQRDEERSTLLLIRRSPEADASPAPEPGSGSRSRGVEVPVCDCSPAPPPAASGWSAPPRARR